MNRDRLAGGWRQVVGRAKEGWGLLTHDSVVAHAGRRERLAGQIQHRYGVARDEAAHAIAAWERTRRTALRPRHRRALAENDLDAT
ncbi:MAG TPA: CsbD family protein [Methylibium sp.]|nr:CsbD family protein [Methylibium sp.]